LSRLEKYVNSEEWVFTSWETKIQRYEVSEKVCRESNEKKALIDALLLERISLRGIGRIVKVSLTWLQGYVNKKYSETPRQVNIYSIKPIKR
jgi:hypothetical protein